MGLDVDNRIVEMQFDNRQFEEGVKESLSTLEKLKKALNFSGADKSFVELEKSARNCDIGIIGTAAEKVGQKFSVMEVAAASAIMNITNKAMYAGERLVKSLSVDQITAGWTKFTDITNSAGTLINQGFQSSDVYDILDKLNWFTDETSYNLTDMVSNISKFTASGQGLSESADAMMGIATWAALSGQNAQKASMAMYQLSQAMGKGVLKYDDWKSIQNANMDTLEFRNKALEAAEAVGILQKQANGLYKTMSGKTHTMQELFSSDAMSKNGGWFTKDVMMRVFGQYSSAVDAMYKFSSKYGITATEIFSTNEKLAQGFDKFKEYVSGENGLGIQDSNIINELQAVCEGLDEFGIRAFRAAQEARSWSDVIDSVKDAVSTGWMNTFQTIFGKYEEAKELWSTLAESMYNVFAEGGERRNMILEKWSEWGGQRYFIDTIYELIHAVENSIGTVKKWWRSAFQSDSSQQIKDLASNLLQVTYKIHDFVTSNKLSEKSLKNLKDVVQGAAAIFKVFKQVLSAVFGIAKPFAKTANSIGGVLLQIAGGAGRAAQRFEEWFRTSNKVQKVLGGLRTASEAINLGFKILILAVEILGSRFKTLISNIKSLSIFNKVGNAFVKVGKSMAGVASLVSAAMIKAVEAISSFFSGLNSNESDPNNSLFIKLLDHIKNGAIVVTAALSTAAKAVRDFFINLKKNGISGVKNMWTNITTNIGIAVRKLKDKFHEFIDWVKNSKIGQFLEPVVEKLKGIIPLLKEFGLRLTEMVSKENLAKAAVIGIVASLFIFMNSLNGAVTSIKKLADTMTGFFTNSLTLIKKLSAKNSKIMEFAKAIATVAGSTYLLSRIPKEDLKEVVKQMAVLTAVIGGTAAVVLTVQKLLGLIRTTGNELDISGVAPAIIAFSISISILVGALWLLQKVPVEGIFKKIGILGLMMAELGGIALVISKWGGTGRIKGTVFILAFAFALTKIAETLQTLPAYNLSEIANSIIFMTSIVGAVGLMMTAVGKFGGKAFLGMAALSLALHFFKDDILEAMVEVGDMINKTAPTFVEAFQNAMNSISTKAVVAIIAITASLITLSIFIAKAASSVTKSILSVVIMFAATIAGLAVISHVANKYPEEIKKAVIAVTAMLLSISALIASLRLISGTKDEPRKIASIIGVVTGVSLLLSTMTSMVAITAKLSSKEGFWSAIMAVEALMTMIDIVMLCSSKAKGTSILPLIGVVAAISTVMVALSSLMLIANDEASYIKGLVGLGVIFTGLGFVFAQLGRLQSATVKIASVAVTLGVLGGVVAGLYALMYYTADNMPDHILDALLEMGGIITALVVAIHQLKKINMSIKDATAIAITLGSLSLCISGLSTLIFVLSNNIGDNWLTAVGVLIGVAALGTGLVASMYFLAKFSKQYSTKKIKEITKSLLSITGCIAVLSGLMILFDRGFNNVWKSLGVLAGLSALVAGIGTVMLLLSNNLKGTTKIVAITVAIAAFSACLVVLAVSMKILESIDNVWKAFGVLSALTGVMVLVTALLVAASNFVPLAAIAPLIGLVFVELGIAALMAAGSMILIAKALDAFNKLDNVPDIAEKMKTLAPAIAIFGLACMALIPGSVGMVLGAVGILALAGALAIFNLVDMNQVAESMSIMSGALAGMALVSVIFAAAMAVTVGILAIASPAMIVASAAIGIFSVALIALNAAMSSLTWLSDKFRNFFDEMAEAATYFAMGVKEGILNSADYVKEAVGEFCQGIVDKFRNFFKIHSPSELMADNAEFIGMGAAVGILRSEGYATDAMEQFCEDTADAFSFDGIIDEVKNFGKEFKENGFSAALESEKGRVEKLLNGKGGIYSLFENMGSKIPIIDEFKQSISGLTDEYKNNTLEGNQDAAAISNIGSAAEKAKTPVEELADSLRNSVDMWSEFQNGEELDPTKVIENMRSQIIGLANWGNDFANLADMGYSDAVLEEMKRLGTSGTNKMKALLQMNADQIAEINDLFNQKELFSNHVANQVQDSMRYVGEMALKGFSDALDPYSVIIKSRQLSDGLVSTLEEELDIHSPSRVMWKEGFYAVSGLTNGISDNITMPQIAMWKLTQKVMMVADSWFSINRWTGIGRNIGEGLMLGIDSSMSDLVMKSELLALKVYTTVKNALGIHSPSTKFEELGIYSGKGYVLGLDKTSGMVKTSAEALGEDSINAFKSSIMQIADIVNGEIDVNPVIMPKLDLSNLRKGTNAINSMFNARRVSVYADEEATENQNRGKENSMTFIQNNYSPKALSRTEIYRQTRNQFTAMRGVVGNV